MLNPDLQNVQCQFNVWKNSLLLCVCVCVCVLKTV